jgi:hypothetical protein
MRDGALRTRSALGCCVCAILLSVSAFALAAAVGATAPPEDIRDIRGPKLIRPRWILPAIISGAALLALCAYGIWRWRRSPPREHPLLPHELAARRLEEIRPLMQPASAREFGIAVSDVIRHYIEQRFGIVATQRTTEEFLQNVLESPNETLAGYRQTLAEFLRQCDLVKFAGMSPALPDMESLHDSARAFVRETAEREAVTLGQTSSA